MENKFSLPVRIYYEDTDAGGVVYNANYIKFLERARTEWLRFHGVEQRALLEEGYGCVVANIDITFKRAAKLDDELFVSCDLIELKIASAVFDQRITDKEGNEFIAAKVKIASVDLKRMRPVAFLPCFKEVFDKCLLK